MIQPDPLKSNAPLEWSPGTGIEVWELFCACIAGDLATVQRLVGRTPALVRSSWAYRTPLHFAVRENRLAVASYLLDKGADPISFVVEDSLLQICRDRGYREMEQLVETRVAAAHGASAAAEPVAAAIRNHDLAQVRSLLNAAPALLHAGDDRSNQPIHWGVMTRQLEVIDELLRRGANIEARRFDGARPIQLVNGDYHYRGWRDVPKEWPVTPMQVLEHLRANGAEVDICTASYIGDLDRVRTLLQQGLSLANRPDPYVAYYLGSGTPLRNAAAKGHLEIVTLLLDAGADPNLPEEGIAPRGYALYSAVANGHHAIAELLLERGAYPNPEVESSADALSRAIANKDERMIELLCRYGAARSVELLACDGDIQTAAAVFAANPKLADDPDALACAAGGGQESFVRLMLRYVPDLPRRIAFPDWGMGAATRELNELLFRHGMDPSQPNWLMATPLHHFARKGDLEKASCFLDHGANVDARDEEFCSTPLGWGAKYGQQAMVELLLDCGARPNLPDDPAWATPLSWATRRGHAEIAELLRARGAK